MIRPGTQGRGGAQCLGRQPRLQVTHQDCHSSDPRRSQLKGKYSIKLAKGRKKTGEEALSPPVAFPIRAGMPEAGGLGAGFVPVCGMAGANRASQGIARPEPVLASPLLSAGISAGLALGSLVGLDPEPCWQVVELLPAPGGPGWVPTVSEANECPRSVSMGHPFQVACLHSSGSSPVYFWGHPRPGWVPLPPGPEKPLPQLGLMRGDLL